MGKRDVIAHCESKSHLDQAKLMKSQTTLPFQKEPNLSEIQKRTEAELQMAVLTATSNVPLSIHDRLSPTIRKVFPDSKIASQYHSASTKATCMLNEAVAPALLSDLISMMKIHPFSLCVDGSNDSDLEQMHPITIRIFDTHTNKIVTRFSDMCTSTSGTAAGIFSVVDGKLQQLLQTLNPWNLCTSVGVDNTSVNIGSRDSIKTRVLRCNPAIYFNGCPCHILHNAAQKAAESFSQSSGFDVEEFVIDLFYWFDKSTKRKNELRSYCTFCDQDYKRLVKHVSTRWLSLELAVQRSLQQLPSLSSYFKSEDKSQARFNRLQNAFSDPLIEVYLLFFQSVLPTFTHCNQFLQREEPLIHVLQPQLLKLLQNVLSKYVKPAILEGCLSSTGHGLSTVDFKNPANHVTDEYLSVGFITKQTLNKLLNEGDISSYQYSKFFKAAKAFLIRATEYLIKWCPLDDELLVHATWLSFESRLEKTFVSVQYFVDCYQELFTNLNMDKLNDQFLAYQLLTDEDIPQSLKELSCRSADGCHQIDILWGYLRTIKKPGSSILEFDLLFQVAELIMTIPHSNAGEERIFSLINKNKTPSRSSLELTGTLSSIIVAKTHIDNPLEWKPTQSLIEKAKKATRLYNLKHSTQN